MAGLVAQQQTVQSNLPEHPAMTDLPLTLGDVQNSNQPPSKTPQSQPKGPTVPKSVSAKSTRVYQSGASLLGPVPRIPSTKGGGAEVGGASQQPGRKVADAAAIEEQPQRRNETKVTLPQVKAGSRSMSVHAPGFPAGKRSKTTSKPQKVSEGDRAGSVPGQSSDPGDRSGSLMKSPTELKFPSPTPPAAAPLFGGGPQTAGTFPRDQNPTYQPPVMMKTPAGPRGSLSTSDESASSSDESCNGHHPSNPTQSTANATAVPMTFFSHLGASGQGLLPVVPEGKATSQLPSTAQSARVASVLDRPLMHAPLPQSQPPHLSPPPQPLPHRAQPGLPQGSPHDQTVQQMSVAGPAQEPGRESPYLESRQVPESSQPEEAWPMVGEELPSRDQLHESLASGLAPLHSRMTLVPPFGVPPSPSSDPALAMMHPSSLQPPLPPGHFNPSAPLPPHLFHPFMFLPPPQGETRELIVESKEVQMSPDSCDTETQTEPGPATRDRKIQVKIRPQSTTKSTQVSVQQDEAGCQTDLQAVGEPLLSVEEIKPPEMTDDSLDAQLHFITDYTLQCLRAVVRHSPAAADKLSATVELVERFEEAFQRKMEEEKQQAEKEAVTTHKALNVDEQNFLQLFTSAQQSLPDPLQGRVPLREEPGRQGRTMPYAFPSLPTVGHIAGSVEPEDALLRLSANPPFPSERTEGGEEEGSLQPHQEALAHPYPHVAPSPMVVPPGARPMVMSVPGMAPMGWYPYMPFPMFLPPHMNMMQHAPPHMAPGQGPDGQTPHMAPGQGPDGQTFLPDEAQQLPRGAVEQELEATQRETQEQPVSGRVKSETMVIPGRSGDEEEGQGKEGGEGGEVRRVTAEVPTAFPSADVKAEHKLGVVGAGTEEVAADPPSPQTLDLVTPLVEQSSQPWIPPLHPPPSSPPPPPSPPVTSAPPDESNPSPSLEPVVRRQPSKDTPPIQQASVHPGLPCRRRDTTDTDHLREKEGAQQPPSKAEKEDASLSSPSPAPPAQAPTVQKQRQGKSKTRQTVSSYRSRGSKDGSYQASRPQHPTGGAKSGSGQSSRSGRHQQQYHSSSQQSVSTQHVSQPAAGGEEVSSQQQSSQPPPPQPQPAVRETGEASTAGGEKTGRTLEADSNGGVKTSSSGSTGGLKAVPTGGGKTNRSGAAEAGAGKTGSSGTTTGVKPGPARVRTARAGVVEAGSGGPTDRVATNDSGSTGGGRTSGSSSAVETSSSGSAGGGKAGGSGLPGGGKAGSSSSAGGGKASSSGSTGGGKAGGSDLTDAVEAGNSGKAVEEGEGRQTENTGPSAESKTTRHQQGYYRPYRHKEGRKVGSGGYRSNPRGQQQGSRTSQAATSHDTSSSSSSSSFVYKQRNFTNGAKPVRGDGSKKPKSVGATPSSANQNQQTPTRGARDNSPMAGTALAQPLPSFKNLYSNSPKDECEDLPDAQNGWPSWTDDGHQLMATLPLSPFSPTTGCQQSSTPHFPSHPTLTHSSFAQCTYDSIWNQANILHFFPALLDPSPQTSPSTNLA